MCIRDRIEYATTVVLSRTQKASEAQLELCVKQIQELNAKAAIITTPWDEIKAEQILKVIEGQDTMEAELLAEAHHREEEEHEHHHHHDHDHHEHDHEHDHHDHEHHHDHDHHHEHGENCTCGCHDHDHEHGHHHADDVFTSWGVETAHKFTEEELTEILHKLAETKDYGDVLRAKGIVAAAEGEWFHFDLVPEETEIRRGAADFTGRICVIGADLKEDAIKELFHVA